MRLARLLATSAFDLHVVTLVRDVRGYVASARRRGKSLQDAARTWKRDQIAIRAVLRGIPDERKLLVRYEDLCAAPERTLARLHDFCKVASIEPSRHVFSADSHVLGNNMRMAGPIEVRLDERWRVELDDREQAQILSVAGDLNREFGYHQ